MLSEKMQEALNAQVNAEMWSAYLYLSMSLDASDKGLKGMSNWFRKQYEEEMGHAFKMVHYIGEQLAKTELKPIGAVPTAWYSPLVMFEETLRHEKEVTASITALCELASSEKDYATMAFLQWFVSEQVEEESSVQGIIDALKLVGEDKAAFFLFDRELGAR